MCIKRFENFKMASLSERHSSLYMPPTYRNVRVLPTPLSVFSLGDAFDVMIVLRIIPC